MEQNVTPGSGTLGDLDRAAPVHKSPTSDPEGLLSNLHAGKAPMIKRKFWIVAFIIAATAILSWFLVREMADAWERRGQSLSPALLLLVL